MIVVSWTSQYWIGASNILLYCCICPCLMIPTTQKRKRPQTPTSCVPRVHPINGRPQVPLALVVGLTHLVPLVLVNRETLHLRLSLSLSLTLRTSRVLIALSNHFQYLSLRELVLTSSLRPLSILILLNEVGNVLRCLMGLFA